MRSPTRRAALAVAAALLLVTAGCLGVTAPTDTGGSSTSDTTNCTYDTNRSTTEPGTWSPDASVEQYPPGVADNGTLVNPSTLLDAHFATTANTSMALRLESSREDRVQTLVHGPKRVPFYSTAAKGPDSERYRTGFYQTDSHGFARIEPPNETWHTVYQNATTAGITAWTGYETFGGLEDQIGNLLYDGKFSVNGTVERGDRTLVELTVDEDLLDTGHGTRRVLVTSDGVIYDVDISGAQGTGDDAGERFEVSMSLDTDVEWCGAPSWFDSIPHLSVSIVEDRHAVEIRNTGGAALSANASFRVYGQEERVTRSRIPVRSEQNGTVVTDERLEPGEAVYVTAGPDGSPSSFALHDDPTRGEYTFGVVGVTGGSESAHYRLLTGIEPPDWAG
ncbi:hypothetical protein [Halobacterium jilantaiense]|uniref:Uncharacterized protein n=1 Tax=Halobacterium jilantaiense TaxID=355548 RepID=A0A1I0NBP2_9EURY|nr:hypothetical protein [Halobacterium jilantaiense]SEV98731.1 hypothetical protein SAMN04487945_0755 [Halobacterium jilantaiense]